MAKLGPMGYLLRRWRYSHAICAILAPLRILNERGNPFTAAGVKALLTRPAGEVIIDDPWGQMTEKPRNFRFSVAGNLRPGLEGGVIGLITLRCDR